MPLLRGVSHSGAVDEPSTSKESREERIARGDESYIQYIIRLLRARRLCRDSIEKRHKMGPASSSSKPRNLSETENLLAEIEEKVSEDIMKAQLSGSPRRALTPRTRSSDQPQASPSGRLSPIEVKVDDEPTAPAAPSNSLLSVNTHDLIGEQSIKQETQILLRVAELKRNGLWSASRLPLCVEPPRNKTHWDYVLEEVKWMATDFRMERQFKRTVARKIAAAIQKKRKDDELEQERAQQRAIRDGKRVCASIAKMVREFWMTVDKVVEHRAQEILEAKKRKALDAHMAFIVGEADKLSSIVQEGLTQDRASKTPSVYSRDEENDDDFSASESESDDEVTIEREEAAMQEGDIEDVKEEVSALSKDADQDMDDFLASLPPEYLASLGLQLPTNSTDSVESPADSEGEDDSKAVRQKERASKADKTRSENDDEVEEVAAKRQKLDEASDEDNNSGTKVADVVAQVEGTSKAVDEDEMSVDEEDTDRLQDQNASLEGNGDGRGMLESVDYSKLNSVNSDERQQELANIAEAALKFQPKGHTLETTQVKTAVPFLIRGTLREYQMVGLDWLVTLYEKNLNGILADEMGLGKTIQTIALLAHLACCESIWGPHLIIVPTSVILNWEMELKKWCPAFKILTYFGTQKDRAEKRRGWSKPNAFHVCITSYKTVTTDIRAFKMKAWQYLILDEAQNIKNFKSQRWQALLNVKARRRLLLTGTPLQNSLMELWSLMHFLMPAIFASHDDFKDWFSNPLTGMMDGSVEFNAPLVQQLHKVLRPFILRRLKSEVEKQLPKKTEHVIKCPLSKRQRYLYDDFMSRRTTRENLKSGNVLSVLNIVMQLRKCCNHPNLFEQRSVESPMCLHHLRLNIPGLLVDLDEKVFGRDLPEIFDLRKRFTGVGSATIGKAPLVKELAESNEGGPPIVPGFRFHRPITTGTSIPSAANSSDIASVVDVSAAELQRAGFAQNEMVLVVRDGEDIDSLLGNNSGAPVPMRVRVNDGRLVLDADALKQNGGSAKLCQVVTGANGEKTLREVSNRLGHPAGGNAPVPVSQVANPAPAAIAAMPGGAASTAVVSSTANILKPERTPYGHPPKTSSTVVHHLLRCTTAVSKVTPLTVSTATSGFHYVMQNGGIHECSEMSESLVDLSASLSPPLKRRRASLQFKEPVTGEFADLIPVEVVQRMEENNRLRLQRIVERFECQQRPFYSNQLISLLRKSTSQEDTIEEAGEQMNVKSVESSVSFDVRESLYEWVADVMKRFWIWVNPAVTDPPELQTSSSGHGYRVRVADRQINEKSRSLLSSAHPLAHKAIIASQLHFPELRLIEYDCGKLQALARLLRRLYALKHRCLIFTQMSRMLDVLQAFLSYHGYQYFRLDGTTGIEQRQAMMERFNADAKIFCFILSTRSGGVGVNLTGADTVIFYDSDWNPTMDAQAQDRCHRIGQTRNVTIFRLISERTIEENILRKANQKRRLGEMAIDDAGFTPEFFKQSDNIRDLFDGDVEVGDIDVGERPKSQRDVEKAMAALEDEQDVTAARLVIAETKADIAEFDETRNVVAPEGSGGFLSCLDSEDPLDEKYIELINQLKPIERYAVNFLEAEYKPEFEEEVREAEAVIEQKREDWVRAHNQALSNGDTNTGVDENSIRIDDDFYGNGMLLDEVFAFDQDFLDEIMPTWTPFPTPPLSDTDNDIYFDECLDLLYDRDFMTEEQLPQEIHELPCSLNKPCSPVKQPVPPPIPPPHVAQQSSSDAAVMSLLNALHNPPNSYTPPPASYSPTPYSPAEFDQYMQGYNAVSDSRVSKKERRTLPRQLEQKGRELMRPVTPPPAVREEYDYEGPEWNIIEDQALLTAVRNEELMCHSFERVKTSLRFNWEYISGFVNRVTRFYRSPRQCSIRYQLVVRPRESGQLMVVDPLTKKPRKVPLTSAEIVHLRKGRVTTELQYTHDADKIREASMLGRLRLINSLAERQNSYNIARRPNDPRLLELSGRLPTAQENRLAAMNIRFPTGLSPQEILSNLEEKRIAQEAAKKKLAEQQANNERPNSPPHPVISVCVRPAAVPAGPEIVQSRLPMVIPVPQLVLPSPPVLQQTLAQDLTMNVMPQSHSPVGGMRRTASHPSTGVAMGSSLQHVQGPGPSTQHNYVVVSQDSLPPSSRMQFVTRTADGMTIGQGAQPVYRSISNTSQTKRTPPNTPSLSRVQGSYMTNVQTVSGNNQLFQPGATTVSGAPRGRVMQRPAAPRMFVQQAPQSGDRSYVVPQQQIRMVSTQRLPPPKRTIGQKAPMTAVMVPSRAGQPHQLRAVPRGFTQGTRIMNVVMAPSSSVASASSSQSLPMQSTSQPGSGTIMASTPPTVRHPSPFSEATGVTVKRQLLAQNRQLGPASRGASPQTVAQVVIAPPQQSVAEEPPPSMSAPASAPPPTTTTVSASVSGSVPVQSSQGEEVPTTTPRQQTSTPQTS
ncbi:hypothetical protein V3C99_002077 [Haemonchus contortus]